MTAVAYFDIARWPTKDEMAEILRQGGLHVGVGSYAVRVLDFRGFQFGEYGGDLGEPCLIADAEDVASLVNNCRRVSAALAKANVSHRFEVHDRGGDCDGAPAAVVQHAWPDADA